MPQIAAPPPGETQDLLLLRAYVTQETPNGVFRLRDFPIFGHGVFGVLGQIHDIRNFRNSRIPRCKVIWRVPLNIDFPISRIAVAVASTVWASRTVGMQYLRFRRFLFRMLRNVLGRMGSDFGFDAQRGKFIANA